MPKRIELYLDMDGVFADCDSGCRAIMGDNFAELDSKDFWDGIDSVDNFFYHLNVLPNSLELYKYVKSLKNVDVAFLSAIPEPTTPRLAMAHYDKCRWIYKHIDPEAKVITVIGGENKYRHVHKTRPSILVDDLERNLIQWKKHYGIGVHHTCPFNSIEILKDILK